MFKIIWQKDNGDTLAKIMNKNNETYLVQEESQFELLGDLSTSSYDVFVSKDMERLIEELNYLKTTLSENDAILHVEEIIELASKCKELDGSRLIFTPF